MSASYNVPRWIVRIEYRSDAGIVDVEHGVLEIADAHDLVENGPDWNTIRRIVISLNPAWVSYPNDTIEAAGAR